MKIKSEWRIKWQSLARKMIRFAGEGRDAMFWSCYLEAKQLIAAKSRSPKPHISELDAYWTDHPPFQDQDFSGNEMRRLRTAFEERGLVPSFRALVEMTETEIQKILQQKQIGTGAVLLVSDIRDEDSIWMRMLEDEGRPKPLL